MASLTHKIIKFFSLNIARPLFKNKVYTIRHGFAKGLRTRGGLSFVPRSDTREESFLSGLDLGAKTVYDVGGFEGIYSIAFARAVGERGAVVVFEPNPDNAARIRENIELNGIENISVIGIALGSEAGRATMVVPVEEGAMGTINGDLKRSFTARRKTKELEISVDTMDSQIAAKGLPAPDFVKIDVEGLDADVLRGMAGTLETHRPALCIELHGEGIETRRENAKDIVTYLVDRGYKVRHVESGETLDISNCATERYGHLYCEHGRND